MEQSDRRSRRDLALVGDGFAPHVHSHAVQFYESLDFLSGVVGDFMLDGLANGDSAVIIATREHASAFAKRLADGGINVADARRLGRVTLLSARETLSRFMIGTDPDAGTFRAEIGKAVSRARRASRSGAVRAYGEMVDILWTEGNREGAIAVERLWNELEHRGVFSLLCAYSLRNFARTSDAEQFQRICEQHTHVAPSESYVTRDASGRLVEIAMLQQRAQSLESEIAERTALAGELRLALDRERATRNEAERARLAAEQAQRVAEEANRSKSQFLAMMSHELRTPLNAIGGYTELIELGIHGPITAEQRDALIRVQRSKRVLLGLIDQVLNYARIETGVVRYVTAPVLLDEVLTSAASLLAPQLASKGLSYRYDGCDARLTVRADREKLEQVVINLLTNAVKFTDRGGRVWLEVECSPEAVTIHVGDTGIGIAADRLEEIFQPFVQVDAKYTRTREGVGLGLAISREFATGMGGSLDVISTPGEGSQFSLTLARAVDGS